MHNLNIELEHPENKASMEYIMNEVNPEDFQYPQVKQAGKGRGSLKGGY